MKRMSVLIVALLFAAPLFAQGPLRIHVTVAKSADGFVEGGTRVADTAKDIREILQDKDHREYVRLVDSPDAAELIYEVKFSGQVESGSTTELQRGIFGGIVATSSAKTLPAVGVVLRVVGKEYRKEFSHVQQLFWKDLAKRIVWQIDEWIVANIKVLREDAK